MTEKYLITGFSGFVAKHFLEYLDGLNEPAYVLGVDIHKPEFNIYGFKHVRCSFERTDLLNRDEVDTIIYQFQPAYILHLASYSSVAFSWKNPVSSFANNTNIFLNLLEKVRNMNLQCRILSVGSSEEYGKVEEKDIPLTEETNLKPVSPYAVARVSQELLSRIYVDGYGLDIVMTRSFNHIGPGQRDLFVVSSFAKQLVQVSRADRQGIITVGDVTVVRDFVDVRDVVVAYHMLLKKGVSGETYNICSGRGATLQTLIKLMSDHLEISVNTVVNENLIRPDENRTVIGCNRKIVDTIGWQPNFSLEQSLQDVISYWQTQ